jgi:hypothetical protein
MKIQRVLEHPLVKLICGLFMFGLTWFTVDISGLVQRIMSVLNNNENDYLTLIDFLIKCVLGQLLFLITYVIVNETYKTNSSRYSDKNTIKFLRQKKIIINEITIFGYSLSFTRYIREYLETLSNKDVNVTIFIPCNELIENLLQDDFPVESRMKVINGRLEEWKRLLTERRIKSLNIHLTTEVPIEHGFLVNDEYMFFLHYNWIYSNGKFILERTPMDNRELYLVQKSKNANYFKYLQKRLIVLEGSADLYQTKMGKHE